MLIFCLCYRLYVDISDNYYHSTCVQDELKNNNIFGYVQTVDLLKTVDVAVYDVTSNLNYV